MSHTHKKAQNFEKNCSKLNLCTYLSIIVIINESMCLWFYLPRLRFALLSLWWFFIFCWKTHSQIQKSAFCFHLLSLLNFSWFLRFAFESIYHNAFDTRQTYDDELNEKLSHLEQFNDACSVHFVDFGVCGSLLRRPHIEL